MIEVHFGEMSCYIPDYRPRHGLDEYNSSAISYLFELVNDYGVGAVKRLSASNDELMAIRHNFKNIPIMDEAYTMHWYGDIARTILANILQAYQDDINGVLPQINKIETRGIRV